MDAAIATNAALSVVTSYMCGLGGDAFWLIFDPAEGRVLALNGSGRSAAGATIEAAHAAGLSEMPVRGPWTVTVPGAIASWGAAHKRFGKLAWADLLAPAIDLASGFAASEAWSSSVERTATVFGTSGGWAEVNRPHGRAWRVGEVVRLTALAKTLGTLAAEGPDAAYTGSLAERAAIYLESEGSPLRLDDFRSNHSDWGEPIATDYRGVTALSHPPNSCGPIALGMLNVLAALTPPKADAFTDEGVTDVGWVHAGLEAARLGLADRDAFLTDADAMTPGALTKLLSREEANRRAAVIDPGRVAPAQPSSLPAGGGTIYLTTADRWGGLVSLIESNYAGFGSGLTDPQTGINYQNRGAFFRLDPNHVNALAPRKRTVHTLTPGILLRDGKPWIAHGSMGGEIQPQVFAQFVSAVVDGGVDIASAISAPRWAAEMKGHLGPPSTSLLESRYDAGVIAQLRELGHDVELAEPFDSGLGHEHAIEIVRDPANPQMAPTFAAAADPRSEGLPGAL